MRDASLPLHGHSAGIHFSARPTGRTVVMSLQKTPGGTRGARGAASSNPLYRFTTKIMSKWHRRSGDKFPGMDLLYLTTLGAHSGHKLEATRRTFPDSE